MSMSSPAQAARARWSSYLEILGARGRPPGWRPSRALVVGVALFAALGLAGMVGESVDERGPLAGVLAAGLIVSMAGLVLWPGPRRPFVEAHPHLDAAFSIPIGLLAALLLTDWPISTCLLATAAYAALIFGLAARGRAARRA